MTGKNPDYENFPSLSQHQADTSAVMMGGLRDKPIVKPEHFSDFLLLRSNFLTKKKKPYNRLLLEYYVNLSTNDDQPNLVLQPITGR